MKKPPVIVLDPRAGHGPGIGGFKRDSEVGIAIGEGNQWYFVTFFPEPCPHHTLADVLHALRRFVEAIAARHPGNAPILYGSYQAGWALALLAADCEGIEWSGRAQWLAPMLLGGSIGHQSDAHRRRSDGGRRGYSPTSAMADLTALGLRRISKHSSR
jgi:hypothetical protein